MLLRAQTVLPVCAPPIDDGAVLVRDSHIEAVGLRQIVASRCADQMHHGDDGPAVGASIAAATERNCRVQRTLSTERDVCHMVER